jgi:dolichol-phosphate mannosyltransferase
MVKAIKRKPKSLISICIPVLNEADSLPLLLERLGAVRLKLKNTYDFEYIFTDNASTDETWATLIKLKKQHTQIRGYRFSRNIGFQRSILYNYSQSKGDAVIQLDADMQDPPELIEEFLKYWQEGYKIVTGVRIDRNESTFMKYFRRLGYWIVDKVSEHPIKQNAGDFRLIDRQVVNLLKNLKSPSPYLRGVISKMGLIEKDILYKRSARANGESKFRMFDLVKLGLNGVANHSNLPWKIANFVGILSLLLSFFGLFYFVALKIYQPDLPRGFASLYVLILFGIGVNTLLFGVLGSYVKKIYEVINGEPNLMIISKIQ